jgi:dihydrofolate reductase
MKISLIVGMNENGVIGKDNKIPWHLAADMAHFKETTMGHPIIMGRKTFDSIGRPLPGRQNIVVTHNPGFSHEGIQVANSLDSAIALAIVSHVSEIFIIGGQAIYEAALPKADRIYLTLVHGHMAGDKHFKYDSGQWKEISRQSHKADDKNEYDYDFIVLERR